MKKKITLLTAILLLVAMFTTVAMSLASCQNNDEKDDNETEQNNNPDDNEKEPEPVIEYTVNFVTNGGSEIASVKVAENGLVTRPADPIKAKHILENWYADESLTVVFDFATAKVTKDITIYAKWTYVPDKFVVTFDTDKGTLVPTVTVEENNLVKKPEDPTKDRYKFIGWFSNKELTTAFDFENTKINADTVIYAKWEYIPAVNTLSYPTGDLFVVPAEGVKVTEGKEFTLAVPTFKVLEITEKKGRETVTYKTKDNDFNKFLGWYTVDGEKLTDETGKSVKNWEYGLGDITVTPRFETTTEVLKFDFRKDGDKTTYEVTATDNIKFMRAVYIPASFENKAVTKIGILGRAAITIYSGGYVYIDWDNTKLPENMELLSLPNTVNFIDKNAYALDDSANMKVVGGKLQRFEVIEGMEGTEPFLTAEDGVLFSNDGATLFRYPVANPGVDGVYTVPETVTEIGDYAFLDYAFISWKSKWCGQLTKVVLPADITHIGKYAFQKRHLLETIEFTDKSDVELIIDDYAFNSTPIKAFVIPGNKSSIPDNTVSIGEYAFASVAGHDDILMIEDIVLPNGLKTIKANAFNYVRYKDKGIKSVFIPKTVTSIGAGAFGACNVLETVTFEEGIDIKEIPDECFAYTKIKNIVLPDSVEKIGNEAFSKSQGGGEPISITLPANLKTVAPEAFDRCYMVNIVINSQGAIDNFASLKIEARTESVKIKTGLVVSDGLNKILSTMTKTTEGGYDVYAKTAK